MTRMWMVDPVLLCQQHLLGEHNELHKLVGVINNHQHGYPIVKDQAEKGNVATSQITARHAVLAKEMRKRGLTMTLR